MVQAMATNIIEINSNKTSNKNGGQKEKNKERNKNEIKVELTAKLFGRFFRLLRRRTGLTCEALAEIMGYKRPTQIIRIEGGLMNVPLSQVKFVCELLKCDKALFLTLRIAAFEELTYDLLGNSLIKEIGYDNYISGYELIKLELEALSNNLNNMNQELPHQIWCGSNKTV